MPPTHRSVLYVLLFTMLPLQPTFALYGGVVQYVNYCLQDSCNEKNYLKYDMLLSSCFPYPVPDTNDFLGSHPEAAHTCSYYINDFYANSDFPSDYYPENGKAWTPVYAKAEGIVMPSLFSSPAMWANHYDAGMLTTTPLCRSTDNIVRSLYLCKMIQTLSDFSKTELSRDYGMDTSTVYQSPWCKMCVPVEPVYTCQSGYTIATPLTTLDGAVRDLFDPSGLLAQMAAGAFVSVKSMGCNVQCEPGTWLTCSTPDYNCRYHVPRDFDMLAPPAGGFNSWVQNVLIQYRDPINALPDYPPPIAGRCFPCNESIGRQHYGKVLDIVPVRDGSTITQMNYRCAGGALAPQRCGLNQAAVVDARGYATQCVCSDGFFRNSSHNDACDFCPAGFYCTTHLNNQYGADSQRACPDGTYSFAGSSACTQCTTQDCPDPSQSRVRCMQLSSTAKTDGQLNFQRSDAICEDCSKCIELGYKKADAMPCLNVATLDSGAAAAGLTRAPVGGG